MTLILLWHNPLESIPSIREREKNRSRPSALLPELRAKGSFIPFFPFFHSPCRSYLETFKYFRFPNCPIEDGRQIMALVVFAVHRVSDPEAIHLFIPVLPQKWKGAPLHSCRFSMKKPSSTSVRDSELLERIGRQGRTFSFRFTINLIHWQK